MSEANKSLEYIAEDTKDIPDLTLPSLKARDSL